MKSRNGESKPESDYPEFDFREKIAERYKTSAYNKRMLRICITLHYILCFLMLLKLLPDILDRLDIFILEIEELEVPKPHMWEYLWCLTIFFTYFAKRGMLYNNVTAMSRYLWSNFFFSCGFTIYALMYYSHDTYRYATSKSLRNLATWRGIPISPLWVIFLLPALQVHIFSALFARKLIVCWSNSIFTKKKTGDVFLYVRTKLFKIMPQILLLFIKGNSKWKNAIPGHYWAFIYVLCFLFTLQTTAVSIYVLPYSRFKTVKIF